MNQLNTVWNISLYSGRHIPSVQSSLQWLSVLEQFKHLRTLAISSPDSTFSDDSNYVMFKNALCSMSNLKHFELTVSPNNCAAANLKSKVKELLLDIVDRGPKLESLDMQFGKLLDEPGLIIDDEVVDCIVKMDSLIELHVFRSNLAPKTQLKLKQLPRLRYLYMNDAIKPITRQLFEEFIRRATNSIEVFLFHAFRSWLDFDFRRADFGIWLSSIKNLDYTFVDYKYEADAAQIEGDCDDCKLSSSNRKNQLNPD